jgi:hypothetical protein
MIMEVVQVLAVVKRTKILDVECLCEGNPFESDLAETGFSGYSRFWGDKNGQPLFGQRG